MTIWTSNVYYLSILTADLKLLEISYMRNRLYGVHIILICFGLSCRSCCICISHCLLLPIVNISSYFNALIFALVLVMIISSTYSGYPWVIAITLSNNPLSCCLGIWNNGVLNWCLNNAYRLDYVFQYYCNRLMSIQIHGIWDNQ